MKNQRRPFLTALALLLFTFAGNAAEFTGNVTDESGEPLIGVNILEQGTTNGTITDLDGNFTLLSDNAAANLEVSYMGYTSQTVAAKEGAPVNVVLVEETTELDDLVVIGYGVQRKSDLTGSIAQVNSETLGKNQKANLGDALQGRAPGLQIVSSGSPGSNVSMNIRGIGSILGSSPLLVIDGVPTDVQLNMLNMEDIESVDVLKDASATAIYGSRGAYGVVIITTKKGQKGEGKNNLSLKASYGVDQITRTLPLLNASQFASLHNEMMTAGGRAQYPGYEDPPSLGAGTDWVSAMTQLGQTQNYSLNYSGGTKALNYYVSGSYLKQTGVIKTTEYERFTMQANMDADIFKWLSAGVNLSLNHDIKSQGEYNLLNAMLALPTQEMYNEDGTWAGPDGLAMYVGDIANPIGKMTENTQCTKGYNLLGNTYLEIKPWEFLTFKSLLGVQALFWDQENWTPAYDWKPIATPESQASRQYNKSLTLLWDNTLTFMKTFAGKHHVNAMIGTSAQVNDYEYLSGSVQGFVSETAQQMNNGILNPIVGGSRSEWSLFSIIARASYNYDNRYYITATVREDGSSRFAPQNRWGTFPSVSLAWRPTQESFYTPNRVLGDFKLRFGYGITGNQASVGNYAYASTVQTIQYVFNGTQVNAVAPLVMPNPNVRWEQVEQINLGFDASMGDDRLKLTVDGYYKNTNDMLVNMSVPISTGYSDVYTTQINAGSMLNAGVEVGITSFNFVGDFQWTTTINFAYNYNEITALSDGVPIYFDNNVNAVGHPVNSFYGYVTDGIFQTQEEIDNHAIQTVGSTKYNSTQPGDIRFKDLNSDGVIDENDRTFLGSPTPSWTFSINNTFSFYGFDLEIFFSGVAGNKIYNGNRASLEAMSVAQNQLITTLDRWTGEGTSNDMPRAVFGDPNRNNRTSDRFIEDGSFLRLKNLSFGYTLPKHITKKAAMQAVRFYISGQNLFTISKYTGLEPEVGGSGNDLNVYPVSRSVTVGASITF